MKHVDAIKELIKRTTGQANVLTAPRLYVQFTGDLVSAMYLGQIVYWSDRPNLRDGWFYKSDKEWRDELGISGYQVRTMTKRLAACGVEHRVQKLGREVRSHYRIDYDRLVETLIVFLESGKTPFSESEEITIPLGSEKTAISENEKTSLPLDTPPSPSIPTTTYRAAPRQPTPPVVPDRPVAASAAGGGGREKQPERRFTPEEREASAWLASPHVGVGVVARPILDDLCRYPLDALKARWASILADDGNRTPRRDLIGRFVQSCQADPPLAVIAPPPPDPMIAARRRQVEVAEQRLMQMLAAQQQQPRAA